MAVENSLIGAVGISAVPQTSNEVSQALAGKELARVQGQVFMAKQFPRDMSDVMNRIFASCERPSLAQISEYEYSRGGQQIVGASIRLLEVVAQCYGNVSYSWKELVRDMDNHKSTVLAYAWDLETNLYSELEFDVYHYRSARGSRILLTDDRDIYELVSNQATRRVRRCLENIIPRDIVEDAREHCHKTLEDKVDWQSRLDNGIQVMKDQYGVSLKQLEERFGMNRRAFTSNTCRELNRIYVSLRDGMAKVEDFFPKEERKTTDNKLPKEETVKEQTEDPQPTLL
ncbi:MAG: hypothetical protein ACLUVC_02340 [Longibaculum sp.]